MKIRRYIKQGGKNEEVNVMQLAQHFGAFGLYLISSLLLLYFYATYYIFLSSSRKAFSIAYDVSDGLSLCSQLCLCWIFLQLAKKEPAPD